MTNTQQNSVARKGFLSRFRRDRRGATAVLVAVGMPAFLALLVLGVDAGRAYYMKTRVQQATQAAALAAAYNLTNYYTGTTQMSTSPPASVTTPAVNMATANAPTSTFGNVVVANSIKLGVWSDTTKTFTALSGTGPFAPNAVEVTGLATSGNTNPIKTLLGSIIGMGSVDVSHKAHAKFGSSKPFNVIVINDVSSSFSGNIGNQRSADTAILNCTAYGNNSAQFGITQFTGHPGTFQALTTASTHLAAITTAITGMNSCGGTGAPVCSGSNAAAGLYSAIQQYQAYWRSTTVAAVGNNETLWTTHAPTNTVNNIVLITDGQPNAGSTTYALTDGMTTNGSTTLCTSACTNANLQSAATYQAVTVAQNLGIVVSTIYYTDSGTSTSQATADTTYLSSLKSPLGTSLVTPTSGQIAVYGGGVCSLMGSVLVN